MRSEEEIRKELSIFEALSADNIDGILLAIPGILVRLVNDRKQAEAALSKLIIAKKSLERNLMMYYMGYSDYEGLNRPPFDGKVAATNLQKFVSTDPDMVSLQTRINRLETYVGFVDRSLEALNTIQWVLKTYTDRESYNG